LNKSTEPMHTELEERLSLAADSAKAHLWDLEIDSGRIRTTEKAKEFFGFAPDRELDLESFLNIVHPEDREKLRLTMEEAVRSGEDNGAEYRIVRPDGSIRWVLFRGQPYPASPGQSARLMGVSIDMTERKQVE
jgi:PAS domain S-box-containing protein